MKSVAIAALLCAIGSTALAAPTGNVTVAIGPALQSRTHEVGRRDLEELQRELQRAVERRLARHALGAGVRLDLVITDATPNRPTFERMANTPGLSFESYGIGGATIDGTIIGADGATAPIHYRWYETDIRHARFSGTWEDAERAFGFFADRLVRGERIASR